MKVKNIAFSGFAAMIFAGLCGVADAASVNLASKSYVDTQLGAKANLIDLEALETTVGQKATQESLNAVATQVNQNTLDIADLKAAGYLTETDLNDLKTTLQAAIDEKQAKGDYADATELQTLKTTVETLQSGTVDKTVVENLQTTVNAISADYAKKTELTAAEERLQAAIDAIEIPDVSNLVTRTELTDLLTSLETEIAKKQNSGDYATADALTAISTELGTLKGSVYTKAEVDQKIADAATGGQIDLSGYATKSALDALTALVNGNTAEINTLKNAGYQTSTQVSDAITAATSGLVTSEVLEAKGFLDAASIATGTGNGTIAVNGTDVPVHGLGSAAYTESSDYLVGPSPVIGTNFLQATCTSKTCKYKFVAYDDVIDQIKADSGIGGL